ncbi:helix-turn-helix transcriptional regulator [Thermaurantiacus sp.]
MTAPAPDELRPLWSLLGSRAEVEAFEAESRQVLGRAAGVKLGTMLVAVLCIGQAAAALSTDNSPGAVAWAAAGLIVVAGARLWWRLAPPAVATGRYARIVEALARGEMTVWRARRQSWREGALDRLDPSVFRHPFARLHFGRSALARWCAQWSWYAPAAPDLLVAGLSAGKEDFIGQEPGCLGAGEAALSGSAVVAPPAAAGGSDDRSIKSRPRKSEGKTGQPALPLFDTCPVSKASQPSIDAKVATPASAAQAEGVGGVSSPRGGRAQLLTIAEVLDMLSMSRSSFYRLIRNSDFPEPLRIGSGVRYNAAEVEAWIAARRDRRS